MVRIEKLTLTIARKTILRDVSLHIEPGVKVAIFGESGSGKTSLLKTCIGLHAPWSGTIEIAGLELAPQHLAKIRSRVFFMPQDVTSVDDESTMGFIQSFFTFKTTREFAPSKPDIHKTFESLNLSSNLLREPMKTLSGGERQRVGIARGLLLGRELMFLDEVTSALDENNRDLIVDRLLNLKGTTVVAVTHDPKFIQRADLRIEMKQGEVAIRG